jgi:hypothetical protein
MSNGPGSVDVKWLVLDFTLVVIHALIPWFATTGIIPWQTALKWTAVCHNKTNPLLLTVAIRATISSSWLSAVRLFLLGYPQYRYTFEYGFPLQSEIQYQPIYIDSPPVCGLVYF